MILDIESSPKSPTLSDPGSPQSSSRPGNSIFSHRSQYPVSYSTFSETNFGRVDTRAYAGPVSDITGLLSQDHPIIVSDDLPPAYHEIPDDSKSRKSNRFWTRCAGVFITVILIYSTGYGYEFAKARRSGRNTPPPFPPSPSSSSVPQLPAPLPSPSIPISSPPAPAPLPGPPPAEPNPNKHYLSPTSGRGDLCRPWSYTTNTESQPSIYEHTSIEHLEYIVPTSAPIHIENSAICMSDGRGTKCAGSVDTMDTVANKLLVIPADIPRPKVELHIQYKSEAVVKNVSICMTKQLLGEGQRSRNAEDYRWVLGINTLGDSDDMSVGVISSINIIVSLPTSQRHDFSTDLMSFSQTIGYPVGVSPYKLTLGTLRIAGDQGTAEVGEISSRVVEVTSEMGTIGIEGARVSESIKMFSEYGHVVCNATLVHGDNGPPIRVDTQSTLGAVGTIVRIEYPSQMTRPPVFDVGSHSEIGRPWAWIIDPAGTASLRAGRQPSVLPTIHANVTSTYAISQVLVPPTFHGSLNISSQFASIDKIDHAKGLPGRSITWDGELNRAQQGIVQWDGRHEREKDRGSVHVATEYAVGRILFLGLDDDGLEHWPKE
ncbi:hypothetical protein BDV93DRAFT_610781 [Ceratobasidium sp. AG-I]|nr:hypothetical protein BDV93DRAFT_610781 [Ceratobasidium sp. AG-I]